MTSLHVRSNWERLAAPRTFVEPLIAARREARPPTLAVLVALCISIFNAIPAQAGIKSEALESAVRYVMKQFDKEVVKELGEGGAAVLARKTEELATRYGEREALDAVQKVGPRVFRLVDGAGTEGGREALRVLARKGEEGVWVVTRRESLDLAKRYGDDAADAMIKHKEIAEPLIAVHGKSAASALTALEGKSARQLAMMEEAGELARLGQTDKVLETVGKYGDGAMNFIWRNKGALATAAALTAFLADPQPFIDGTRQLAEVTGDALVKPLAQTVGAGVAHRANWTAVLVVSALVLGVVVGWRMLLRRVVRR